jgi:hypothetical protein
MSRFLLHHEHGPDECRIAFAAWKGFSSPLRHRLALASCAFGGHEIWWDVEAVSARQALDLLPPFIARRTRATPIGEVEIP